MDFQNVNTNGISKMQTIDALNFLKTLTTKKQFTEAKTVHTGLFSAIVDKKNSLMTNVTLLVQTFGYKNEDGKFFVLTQARGTDFGCSNGIVTEETDKDSWRMEAHFIKRFNELT
ncbi:MAG: hypothetical protein V4547_16265 [Bacteroidota bacterium]